MVCLEKSTEYEFAVLIKRKYRGYRTIRYAVFFSLSAEQNGQHNLANMSTAYTILRMDSMMLKCIECQMFLVWISIFAELFILKRASSYLGLEENFPLLLTEPSFN